MEKDKRNSFVFMLDWIPLLKLLNTKEEVDELFQAIKDLVNGAEPVVKSPRVICLWEFFGPKITDNLETYEQAKEKRIAALKRYNDERARQRNDNDASTTRQRNDNDASTNNVTDTVTGTVTVTGTDTVTGTVTVTGSSKEEFKSIGDCKGERSSRFVPPTVEELNQFILENGYHDLVDAQVFHDYYEANGWKIGKGNQMKNWKAAVRMWANREDGKQKRRTQAADSFLTIDWSKEE